MQPEAGQAWRVCAPPPHTQIDLVNFKEASRILPRPVTSPTPNPSLPGRLHIEPLGWTLFSVHSGGLCVGGSAGDTGVPPHRVHIPGQGSKLFL